MAIYQKGRAWYILSMGPAWPLLLLIRQRQEELLPVTVKEALQDSELPSITSLYRTALAHKLPSRGPSKAAKSSQQICYEGRFGSCF